MNATIHIPEPGWYRITGSLENPVATKLPGPQVGDRVEPGDQVGQSGNIADTCCGNCPGACYVDSITGA